jgi:hypothetical protein
LKGAGGQKVVPSIERVDALGELARSHEVVVAGGEAWWLESGRVCIHGCCSLRLLRALALSLVGRESGGGAAPRERRQQPQHQQRGGEASRGCEVHSSSEPVELTWLYPSLGEGLPGAIACAHGGWLAARRCRRRPRGAL